MKISPKAMEKVISDPVCFGFVKNEDVDSLRSHGFDVVSDMVLLKGECRNKTGLLDHRSVKWSLEESNRRYFDCVKEINTYGNQFSRELLSQHEVIVERRTDFNKEQLASYRKLLVCSWHNIKIVRGISVNVC